MSMLSRLFATRADDRAVARPLWARVVAIAREPGWYLKGGVADTMTGRFDMLTMVLALVLLRMERDEALLAPSARLTELFVEDMDGQLRQEGLGDPTLGKRMGKIMEALGGRCAACREALAQADNAALVAAVERNVTFAEGQGDAVAVATELRVIAAQLAALSAPALLAGQIAR